MHKRLLTVATAFLLSACAISAATECVPQNAVDNPEPAAERVLDTVELKIGDVSATLQLRWLMQLVPLLDSETDQPVFDRAGAPRLTHQPSIVLSQLLPPQHPSGKKHLVLCERRPVTIHIAIFDHDEVIHDVGAIAWDPDRKRAVAVLAIAYGGRVYADLSELPLQVDPATKLLLPMTWPPSVAGFQLKNDPYVGKNVVEKMVLSVTDKNYALELHRAHSQGAPSILRYDRQTKAWSSGPSERVRSH